MNAEVLAQAVLISYIAAQLMNSLVKPLIAIVNAAAEGKPIKAMVLELWPLYIGLLFVGGIGWFANIDLLSGLLPAPIGRILTSLAIGLGPSFLYDTFLDKPEPTIVVQVPVGALSAATEKAITDQVTAEAGQ